MLGWLAGVIMKNKLNISRMALSPQAVGLSTFLMLEKSCLYMWRCAKCFYHFANISKVQGVMREEKKCPKCKALNVLTLSNKQLKLECRFYDPTTNGYTNDETNGDFFKDEHDF